MKFEILKFEIRCRAFCAPNLHLSGELGVPGEAKIFGIIGIPVGLLSGNLASFILIKVCNMLIAEDINIVMYFDPAIGANVLAILLSIVTIYFSALSPTTLPLSIHTLTVASLP